MTESTELSQATFDYGTVAPEVAVKLRDRADKISVLNAKVMGTILSVGRELIQAKAQIGHGDFECWVETEAHISIRAAQNYMAVARFADAEKRNHRAFRACDSLSAGFKDNTPGDSSRGSRASGVRAHSAG